MYNMVEFLNKLEQAHISYSLVKDRDFSITVLINVPGERWEVDFLYENESENDKGKCSGVWVEKFISTGTIFDEKEIDVLFENFSD